MQSYSAAMIVFYKLQSTLFFYYVLNVIMVEYKHSHVILNLHHFVMLKSSSSSINLLARVILSHEKVSKHAHLLMYLLC